MHNSREAAADAIKTRQLIITTTRNMIPTRVKFRIAGLRTLLRLLPVIIAVTGSLKAAVAQDSLTVVRYSIARNWVKMIEGVDYISSQQKERTRYMYGNQASYTTYSKLWFNDSVSFYSDDISGTASYGYSSIREPFLIRRNFGSMEVHDVLTWLRKTYIIEDSLVVPRWKILNDIREIAGHICMNASITDTVKGQHIIAWFALDMPSFAGPERLCGLPGLILGVEVNNGAMEIMAQSIETVALTDQLTMPARFDGRRIRGKNISEADYQEMIYNYMDEKRKTESYPFWGVRY